MSEQNKITADGEFAKYKEPTKSFSVVENMNLDEIQKLRRETKQKMIEHGLTRETSRLLRRGESVVERQANWPFDIYQASNLIPIDYKYWEREITTDVGKSKCIAMHAVGYASTGENVAADQVFHKETLQAAHKQSRARFMEEQNRNYDKKKFGSDWWNLFRSGAIQQAKINSNQFHSTINL